VCVLGPTAQLRGGEGEAGRGVEGEAGRDRGGGREGVGEATAESERQWQRGRGRERDAGLTARYM